MARRGCDRGRRARSRLFEGNKDRLTRGAENNRQTRQRQQWSIDHKPAAQQTAAKIMDAFTALPAIVTSRMRQRRRAENGKSGIRSGHLGSACLCEW